MRERAASRDDHTCHPASASRPPHRHSPSIAAGENIYPAELERVLVQHEGIADVAVIGIPDDRWGEVPIAVVVRRPGATLTKADVMSFARKHFASFKMLRSVEFIDALPRNPSGKLLKRVLREPFWAGRPKRVN